MNGMVQAAAGGAILLATAFLFWLVLPGEARSHRLVGTGLEPYVSVALLSGFAFGGSMLLLGLFGGFDAAFAP